MVLSLSQANAYAAGLGDLRQQVAISVGEDSLQTLDLLLLGVLREDWIRFEREVARGLALQRVHGEIVTPEEVRAEATRFRYAHNLISASEFKQWLALRGLSTGDLSGFLRRLLLRRRYEDTPECGEEDLLEVLRAEALGSGILTRLREEGVGLLAAGQLAPAPGASAAEDSQRCRRAVSAASAMHALRVDPPSAEELRDRVRRLLWLEDSGRRLRHELAGTSAVATRVRDHAFDWLELAGDRLSFAREGAAREARLLLRDGETPAAVSERAATPVLQHRLLVGEAPAELRGFFAAAAVGEVIGPWEQDGLWHVMEVLGKRPPSPEDEAARDRALQELWTEAVERHAAGRTRRDVAL